MLASEGVASISDHRRKAVRDDRGEEMEGVSNAANTDPEIGYDQPDDV